MAKEEARSSSYCWAAQDLFFNSVVFSLLIHSHSLSAQKGQFELTVDR